MPDPSNDLSEEAPQDDPVLEDSFDGGEDSFEDPFSGKVEELVRDESGEVVREIQHGKRGGGRIHCPNCGRYCGPLDRCPYCLAVIDRPNWIMRLRYGCVILSILSVTPVTLKGFSYPMP